MVPYLSRIEGPPPKRKLALEILRISKSGQRVRFSPGMCRKSQFGERSISRNGEGCACQRDRSIDSTTGGLMEKMVRGTNFQKNPQTLINQGFQPHGLVAQ